MFDHSVYEQDKMSERKYISAWYWSVIMNPNISFRQNTEIVLTSWQWFEFQQLEVLCLIGKVFLNMCTGHLNDSLSYDISCHLSVQCTCPMKNGTSEFVKWPQEVIYEPLWLTEQGVKTHQVDRNGAAVELPVHRMHSCNSVIYLK